MARARNIKPSLFKNEILGEADPLLTILFQGLWCLADREGRLEDRPKRIKAEIFPYRELPDFNGYLTELEQLGFIQRYETEIASVIQVINFSKHQSPHKTEKGSELPERPVFTGSKGLTGKAPLNNESITEDAALIPDSGFLIPEPLTHGSSAIADKPPAKLDQQFDLIWKAYPKREGSNPKNKALSGYRARIKEGISPDLMAAGVERYYRYCQAKGTIGTEYVMQAQRFFGKEKAFENDWIITESENAADQQRFTKQSKSDRDDEAMRKYLAENSDAGGNDKNMANAPGMETGPFGSRQH